MTQHSHQTAPTQFVDAAVFGSLTDASANRGVPLVFTCISPARWIIGPGGDGRLRQGSRGHPVRQCRHLSSSGEVPTSIEEMAADAAAFVKALDLSKVDVLGFSLGGPHRTDAGHRRTETGPPVVLVGTGPRSGEGMATADAGSAGDLRATYEEAGKSLAARAFLALGAEPGRRPPISSSGSAAERGSRSGGQREGCPGTARSTRNGARRARVRTSI